MLRFLIAVVCSFWAACSFGQSSPTSIPTSSAAKLVCKSESDEVVLHANASATLPVVDILPCGAEVTVTSKQAGWYRVRTQDGKEGWVKETFFSATTPVEQATSHIKDGYIKCTPGATGVNLLQSSEGYFMMRCGEKVEVLEEEVAGNKDAYKIKTNGGNVGHVWRGFVSWYPQTAEVQTYHLGYAIRATREMRDGALDPASFTLMQVVSYYTNADKKGRIEIGGCVHFVASNAFGGRVQQWGWYEITRYSDQFHSAVLPYDSCVHPRDAVVTDVTAEVKKALSLGDGQ